MTRKGQERPRPRAASWLAAGGTLILLLAGGGLALQRAARATGARGWAELLGPVRPAALNVVLITVDTLRADHLSCYGSEAVDTPAIDALAREGVLFTNAASTVPLTLPAHASILTGTYPPHHGVRENVGQFLDPRIPTLAGMLGARGWATAGFVSAFVLDARWGIGGGFEHYFDDFDGAETGDELPSRVERPGDQTLAEAVRWLDRRPAEAPFLLWLHLYDPHDPYAPPEPYRTRYADRPYDGEVAFTDALVGELRRELEERDLLDRSLLIFTGDHGEGLGDHGEMFHGYFVYESTIRVPLIIRPPSRAVAGRVVDRAVSHVDIMPTILEAVGLPPPPTLHGESLLPLMLGVDAPPRPGVYCESLYPLLHYGWAPLRSIRADRYKLIQAPRPELYDLIDDHAESLNLAATRSDLSRELQRHLGLLRGQIEGDAPSAPVGQELDEETLARLSALGYVAGESGVGPDQEEDRPRVDPKDKIEIHQRIRTARGLMGRGRDEAAGQLLQVLRTGEPDIVEVHEMLGTLATKRGRPAEGVEHFERALELNPTHARSLSGLATAYRALGRHAEALRILERLRGLPGQESRASYSMAQIHVAQGQLAEAATVLERATGRDDAPGILDNLLGEIRAQQRRVGEARLLFQRAIEKNERLARPYYNLAVLHEERGEVEQAMALYGQAIERDPGYYEAQFNLGRLYGEKGDVGRQQELWEAALVSNPEFVPGYLFLARLLADRGGDLGRAEKLARRALEKDPDHETGPLGYYVLAHVLSRAGRRDEAERALSAARAVEAGKE